MVAESPPGATVPVTRHRPGPRPPGRDGVTVPVTRDPDSAGHSRRARPGGPVQDSDMGPLPGPSQNLNNIKIMTIRGIRAALSG